MAIHAAMNAMTNPVANMGASELCKTGKVFNKSNTTAAKIIGTAARKEYCAAVSRAMPSAMPPTIVHAERDIPGHNAKH